MDTACPLGLIRAWEQEMVWQQRSTCCIRLESWSPALFCHATQNAPLPMAAPCTRRVEFRQLRSLVACQGAWLRCGPAPVCRLARCAPLVAKARAARQFEASARARRFGREIRPPQRAASPRSSSSSSSSEPLLPPPPPAPTQADVQLIKRLIREAKSSSGLESGVTTTTTKSQGGSPQP